ncbi:UPF0104 family protein [Candidatus Sumerlaeota bacterium]|nr:UPF0104 family protein [Candidatus Sumerlaeota bacterium]
MKTTRDQFNSYVERASRFFKVFPFILLVVAIFVLRREFAAIVWKDVFHTISQVSVLHLIATGACIAVSYCCAGASDWLGVRHAGSDMPLWKIIKTAVIARAFSNTIGVGMLSGGVVRFRYYSDAKLEPLKIARVIIIYSFGCAVGLVAMGGLIFILFPHDVNIPRVSSTRPMGVIMLLVVAIYLTIVATVRKPLNMGGIELKIFDARNAFRHLPFAMLDWLAAGFGLYTLVASVPGLGMDSIIAAYFLAMIVGHLSGVPSAMGVFEAAVVIFLGGNSVKEAVLPWLILYRLVFYLVPFCVGFLYVAMTLSGGIGSLVKRDSRA